MTEDRFAGKVAVVTGAGRRGGIGEAIARRLAREGARIAIVDLGRQRADVPGERFAGEEEMESVLATLRTDGADAIALAADVTDEDAVAAAMTAAEAHFGRIDHLFSNAGGGTGAGPVDRTAVADLALADWRYTMQVSLESAYLCAKHAAPRIARAGGGSIVNTGSISAHHGIAGMSAYAAAKYGLVALTRNLAVELAPQRIRVNAFAPGMTLTPYVRQRFAHRAAVDPSRDAEAHLAAVAATIPLGRAAMPEEMAAVAAFLASDDASYVTGQTIRVDGGMRV